LSLDKHQHPLEVIDKDFYPLEHGIEENK